VPLAGARQIRIRGSVQPELAARLGDPGQQRVLVELRDQRGARLLRAPASISWAELRESAGTAIEGLAIELDMCLSIGPPERGRGLRAGASGRAGGVDRGEAMRRAWKARSCLTDQERRARDAEIVSAYQAGETQATIAGKHGISDRAVAKIVRREIGERERTRRAEEKRLRNAAILAAHDAGETQIAIAQSHSLSRPTVGAILRGAGRKRRLIAVSPEDRSRRDQEIIAAYEAGETQASIGARYGMSHARVSQIVHGQTSRGRTSSTPEDRSRRDLEIAAAHEAGESQRTIAMRYGISRPLVSAIVRRERRRREDEEAGPCPVG